MLPEPSPWGEFTSRVVLIIQHPTTVASCSPAARYFRRRLSKKKGNTATSEPPALPFGFDCKRDLQPVPALLSSILTHIPYLGYTPPWPVGENRMRPVAL